MVPFWPPDTYHLKRGPIFPHKEVPNNSLHLRKLPAHAIKKKNLLAHALAFENLFSSCTRARLSSFRGRWSHSPSRLSSHHKNVGIPIQTSQGRAHRMTKTPFGAQCRHEGRSSRRRGAARQAPSLGGPRYHEEGNRIAVSTRVEGEKPKWSPCLRDPFHRSIPPQKSPWWQ